MQTFLIDCKAEGADSAHDLLTSMQEYVTTLSYLYVLSPSMQCEALTLICLHFDSVTLYMVSTWSFFKASWRALGKAEGEKCELIGNSFSGLGRLI